MPARPSQRHDRAEDHRDVLSGECAQKRGPAHARIKRVRLPFDTRTVDNQDEVEESEDYESLRDRVRRGPLREVLLWTILVAGAIWVVLNAIVQIRFVWFTGRFASIPSSVFIWAQAVAGIAYPVFLVALGSYVVLWLALREESS